VKLFCGALSFAVVAVPACAQKNSAADQQKPTVEDLLRRIDALQHRLSEIESRKKLDNTATVAAVHRTLPACAPGGTPATAAPTATTAAGLSYRTTNRIPGSATVRF